MPGKPPPESMIAENDDATGLIVDALSHSRWFASSVLFLIEDDPQDGGDHVDAHRSICVIVSPWTRHGMTSSVHYDIASLYRTIERLLGTEPLYQADANAAARPDIGSSTADLPPFMPRPRLVPDGTTPQSGPMAGESEALDYSAADRAPEPARILWRHFKGTEPPWTARAATTSPD